MGQEVSAPILVVDDDPKTVSLVKVYLEREGYRVVAAGDGRAALSAADEWHPQLVVLDLMLPEVDGFSVMRRLRETSDIPVVMLSARGAAPDRVYGMSEGADDYLAKPFSPAELVVRIKAVLRRAGGGREETSVTWLGDLEIDVNRLEIKRAGSPVSLTPAEFRLLVALVGARGRVLSRQALLDALHGTAAGDALERTIDVHIGRLRDKLAEVPTNPRYIVTVRGAGYRAQCA
jgi:DNA-binding response OmpR family regulator